MLTDEILLKVSKPGRYIGGEWNSVVKDYRDIKCKVALVFPDVYEIGMSHLGLKILYCILNKRQDIACERVFAPWFDMENIMREKGIPLFSLETKRSVREFDILGFSLQYELSYTNVLNMLDLAGIPLFSAGRDDSHPLIIGGGPCVFNPEPMADFFDCFVIGDGEDIILEIADFFIENKNRGCSRKELLKGLSAIEGIYVPFIQKRVKKRLVLDLDKAHFPEKVVVPYIETVHDRIQLEIMRGCRRSCNFCQAAAIYSPVRYRSSEKIISLAKSLYANTGYDEVSLVSLSSGDHPQIRDIVSSLNKLFKNNQVSISLPSLRIEDLAGDLAFELTAGRRPGLTFAPEVGSEKMRKVINKNISPATLKECAYKAFRNKWERIKLYFMIGLPEENYEDLDAIVELAKEVSMVKIKVDGRPAAINASVSVFVPKSHTRFERVRMLSIDEVESRQRYIRNRARATRVNFSFHDVRMSYVEGVFSRGDRNLSKSVYSAWKKGCKFDAWSDYFNFDNWMAAFADTGIPADDYSLRSRAQDEALPWEFIDI